MAEILVRMEMPESCSDCPMCYDQMECTVRPIRFWYEELPMDFCNERHPDCPLIALPEHGNLIDRDALPKERVEWEDIVNAPVVIPANKEESE